MRITKRSRRRSELFDSRFRTGGAADFPLRQYLRCREDFFAGIVHAALLLVFLIVIIMFTGTIDDLFRVHGQHLRPAYRYIVLGLMVLFSLFVLRRLYYKVRELRSIRLEMTALQARFRQDDDEVE